MRIQGRRGYLRKPPPPLKVIATPHVALIQGLPNAVVEAPTQYCWGCGIGPGGMERAHIRPYSAGGDASPENFFLLCSACHRTQPDTVDPETQIDWLRSVPHHFDRLAAVLGPLCMRLRDTAGDDIFNHYAQVRGLTLANKLIAFSSGQSVQFRLDHPELFQAAAGMHTGNVLASSMWAIHADFRAWLRQPRHEADGQTMLLFALPRVGE